MHVSLLVICISKMFENDIMIDKNPRFRIPSIDELDKKGENEVLKVLIDGRK